MPEAEENSSGNPVIEQGPYSRLTSGAKLRYQPDRVVVLSGPGGYRVVSVDEPIGFFQRWAGSYTHYAIVDTTAKQAVRNFRHAHSSDPRYTFEIQVTMSASVDDPVSFLRVFGSGASVFDAFYNELVEDVANTLSDCPINDLVGTQQRLSDYARDIKKSQPFYKGVKIHQFNVVVKYGPELIRKLEEYDIKTMIHREGEAGLIIQGAVDPAMRERNDRVIQGIRASNDHAYDKGLQKTKDAMEIARQYAELANLDFVKVARQAGLEQRMHAAIAPLPPSQQPLGLLFSEKAKEKEELFACNVQGKENESEKHAPEVLDEPPKTSFPLLNSAVDVGNISCGSNTTSIVSKHSPDQSDVDASATRQSYSADPVVCSVFAPSIVKPGNNFLIQALLHTRPDWLKAAQMARRLDAETSRRGSKLLEIPVERGATIDIMLDCPELQTKNCFVSLEWRGSPENAVFQARMPSSMSLSEIEGAVVASVDGVPLGEVRFKLFVEHDETRVASEVTAMATAAQNCSTTEPSTSLASAVTEAVRYRNAFISYARADFEKVRFFAEALGHSGVNTFIDVAGLSPGEEWAPILDEKLRTADVVFLMWSDNAAKSKAVDHEVRFAMKCQLEPTLGMPRIKPITMHRGVPKPPEHLLKLHFDSVWLAHCEAQKNPLFVSI